MTSLFEIWNTPLEEIKAFLQQRKVKVKTETGAYIRASQQKIQQLPLDEQEIVRHPLFVDVMLGTASLPFEDRLNFGILEIQRFTMPKIYTKEEDLAILNYTQETPPSINMALRGEIKEEERIDEYICLINAFLKNRTDEEMISYRGIDHPLNGDYIINEGLLSTTDEITNALHFCSEDEDKNILSIIIPKGTFYINIGDIDVKYHDLFIEKEGGEIILLPGKLTILETIVEYEFKGMMNDGENYVKTFDENNKYNLIVCQYEQLESIEDTIKRLQL
jgi:hypothetical protein